MRRYVTVIGLLCWTVASLFLNGHAAALSDDLQLEATRSIKTVCIVVEQSYPKVTGKVDLHFQLIANKLLTSAGLKVADVNCDATLRIRAVGEVSGAYYVNPNPKGRDCREPCFRVTGGSLGGTISLERAGTSLAQDRFDSAQDFPRKIWESAYIDDKQVLWNLLKRDGPGAFIPRLSELLARTFGVERLIAVLKNKDWRYEYVHHTTTAFGSIGRPAVRPLIAVLKDRGLDDWVRESAAESLGTIGDPLAVEHLIEVMKEISGAGSAAISSLAKMRDVRAVEPLISLLKHKNCIKRQEAATALGSIKDPRAIEPLISLLREFSFWELFSTCFVSKKFPHQAASESLEQITGQDFGGNADQYQEWWARNKASYKR